MQIFAQCEKGVRNGRNNGNENGLSILWNRAVGCGGVLYDFAGRSAPVGDFLQSDAGKCRPLHDGRLEQRIINLATRMLKQLSASFALPVLSIFADLPIGEQMDRRGDVSTVANKHGGADFRCGGFVS